MNSTIRAVAFDVGGTLIQPWPSVGHVYAGVAARFGFVDAEAAALNREFSAAWKRRAAHDYSRVAWRSLVNETFAGAGAAHPLEECFDALYHRFEHADAWRVFDDVRPVLGELRSRGLKLCVISNWDERLRPLLDLLDLTRWFEVIVISHEAGQTKPSPEIFHQAAAQLKLSPEHILHVGDSAREDVEGARQSGMQALLLDRGATGPAAQVIATLAALPELLESLSH